MLDDRVADEIHALKVAADQRQGKRGEECRALSGSLKAELERSKAHNQNLEKMLEERGSGRGILEELQSTEIREGGERVLSART